PVVEGNGKDVVGFIGSLCWYLEPVYVFCCVVVVGPPQTHIAIDDDGPSIRFRNGKDGIGSRPKRLTVDLNIAGSGKLRRLVGAGAPDLSEGHEFSEDFPVLALRLTVSDRDVMVFITYGRDGKGSGPVFKNFLGCEVREEAQEAEKQGYAHRHSAIKIAHSL